jgi:hypothetical protein
MICTRDVGSNQTAQASAEVVDRAACDRRELAPPLLTLSRNEIRQKLGTRPSDFTQKGQNGFRERLVIRPPQELHVHPALARLNLVHSVTDLNEAFRLNGRNLPELIRITQSKTIIGGFSDWHEAVSSGRPFVDCIEYSLTDEEALEFILIHHQPRRTWKAFNRVILALELEPYFQKKASANQIAGGKHKGSASLPKAEHIDVREKLARIAGVSARNVGNVKTILEKAHTRLIDALQDGTVSIHRAVQLCNLSRTQQLEQLLSNAVERATSKVTRQAVAQLRMQGPGEHVVAVLRVLQELAAQDPGSVVVRPGSRQQTVILLGRDLQSQVEPTLT